MLTIFKQRLSISRRFYNSTVKHFLAPREWHDCQAEEQFELNHRKDYNPGQNIMGQL